jgi:hypothetical protein
VEHIISPAQEALTPRGRCSRGSNKKDPDSEAGGKHEGNRSTNRCIKGYRKVFVDLYGTKQGESNYCHALGGHWHHRKKREGKERYDSNR